MWNDRLAILPTVPLSAAELPRSETADVSYPGPPPPGDHGLLRVSLIWRAFGKRIARRSRSVGLLRRGVSVAVLADRHGEHRGGRWLVGGDCRNQCWAFTLLR